MPPAIARPTPRKSSQAALVTAWLGTYELLVSDTIRVLDIAGRREVVQTPGPDALAHAATALVGMMDLEGAIFTGVGNNLSPLEESIATRMDRAGITFSPEDDVECLDCDALIDWHRADPPIRHFQDGCYITGHEDHPSVRIPWCFPRA